MEEPTILVSTWEDGLFAVTGEECVREIVKQPVRGLAVDGRGGALGIVGGHELWRRVPGGGWARAAPSEFELSCCMAVRDTIYVGTDDARMLRLNDASGALEPIEGFDKVAGRDTWFAGSAIVNGVRRGPPLGIRSVAANADGSVLFANVHVGGIPRSTDGGRSWEPTIDLHSDVHEVSAHPADARIVVAAAAVGLCISRDSGATWTIEREGLHAAHCSAVAIAGEDVLVSAGVDPFSAEGRIYRRPLRAASVLTAVEGGMPEWTEGIVHSGCLAANGHFVGAADRAGTVYVSDDFGRSWTSRRMGLPNPSGLLLF